MWRCGGQKSQVLFGMSAAGDAMQRTSGKSLALATACRKGPALPGMSAESHVFIFHMVRKLTDSTRATFPTRVDCEKPTTQHETFLRVFVNVKEYQSKLSSVLSTGGNHAKSEEYGRDSASQSARANCHRSSVVQAIELGRDSM